ncbi:hypothetical protein Lal_00013696, partial [Lupinus albus]
MGTQFIYRGRGNEAFGPFPYKSDKAVPWKYQGKSVAKSKQTEEVVNLVGVGNMTRSGRVYSPVDLSRKIINASKRKEKIVETSEDRPKPEVTELFPEKMEREVSEEEACEFLRFIKQSEYQVIDQLSRTPAKVSLLSLLMNSEAHRKVLFKVLNRAHVNHDISTDKLSGIINNIMIDNFISFSDQGGRVLIDNGASLNVMTKRTLSKLPVEDAILGPSSTVVKAFDGARRDVLGEIELPIKIGHCTFKVLFQVMDINPSFSCLLGRPWIHSAGTIPSSLHQKVKFITGGRLIRVMGEEDTLVSQLSDAPYVEADSEALEASFRALEIENASSIEKGHPMLNPLPSNASIMMAKFIGRAGLGYSPSNYREGASEDKKGGVAQLDTIAMVEYGQLESDLGPVYQCIPGTGLSNWTEEDVASDVYYA